MKSFVNLQVTDGGCLKSHQHRKPPLTTLCGRKVTPAGRLQEKEDKPIVDLFKEIGCFVSGTMFGLPGWGIPETICIMNVSLGNTTAGTWQWTGMQYSGINLTKQFQDMIDSGHVTSGYVSVDNSSVVKD